jgi:hypothetical protein
MTGRMRHDGSYICADKLEQGAAVISRKIRLRTLVRVEIVPHPQSEPHVVGIGNFVVIPGKRGESRKSSG